ncbi:cell division protein ZapB [Halolamina litorea]|uniref:DUF7527 domain-containing protein n=1 Tax=Halolamina litorea TaxID=1515593 RepID=A0ABD6BTB2_9EURY|nr:hypothetical protein [Halolamina litorea]
MERNTVERVTEWDSEPFSDGYAGLRDLADREFTGAVTDGTAWLFMLNGRVLGSFEGDLSRFEDADGTAFAAPDRSLPLLFAMQETGGEERGEYYTEQTPLSEVDGTLTSGNFTGYVELSENVLSGDYYLVYYGGRRMAVAFVGNQERRLTGDEAFERAADEVGIYRVTTVGLDIEDIPEPEPTPTPTATDPDPTATDSEPPTTDDEQSPQDTGSAADDPDPAAETAASGRSARAETESDTQPTDRRSERTTEPDTPPDRAEAASTVDEPAASTADSSSGSWTDREVNTAADPEPEPEPEPEPASAEPASAEPSTDQFESEAEWRGTTTIPALDPSESVTMTAEPPAEESDAAPAEPTTQPSPAVEELRAERDQLQERVSELEAETERLGGERDRLAQERDEATSRADDLEAEIDELQETIDRLEAQLRTAEEELSAAEEYVPEGDHELSPEAAMEGTSLFVRYERKGGPTLEDAQRGDAGRDAVTDNLRLEHHTEFEDDGAVVDGRPFEEWLHDTIEYGFVVWLTQSFIHDIRETRNQTAMGTLFEAIPAIDRVEFRGTVDLGEEAEEESAAFDVVLRDRMGSPLLVTDLNDSREPATEPMLESLIRNATPVAEATEELSAAFFVTSSYYEPGALETAQDATGGGFLNRGRQKSFVKLSRKEGYHLCLIETRDGEFHVSVPEL